MKLGWTANFEETYHTSPRTEHLHLNKLKLVEPANEAEAIRYISDIDMNVVCVYSLIDMFKAVIYLNVGYFSAKPRTLANESDV